jgi:acetylxylan esterase
MKCACGAMLTKRKIIPHTASQNCKDYASRILSFCDTGDPFCDSGQDMTAHMKVVNNHLEEAKAFILNKLQTLSVPVRQVNG